MVSADPWLPNVPVAVLPPPTADTSGDETDDLDEEEEEEESDDLDQVAQPVVIQRTTRELHCKSLAIYLSVGLVDSTNSYDARS